MQRKELQSGLKKSRMFVGGGGVGVLHWQRRDKMGQIEQSRYTRWGPRRRSHSVERLKKQRRSKNNSKSESFL